MGHMGKSYLEKHIFSYYNFMNKVLVNIFNSLSDNSMLIVLGDHGMTEGGSHGGGSHEEIETGLFFRYKGKSALNKLFTDELQHFKE
jgi:phosphatidylinositol glycan class O